MHCEATHDHELSIKGQTSSFRAVLTEVAVWPLSFLSSVQFPYIKFRCKWDVVTTNQHNCDLGGKKNNLKALRERR